LIVNIASISPGEALLARMGAYHEELAKAGVLLDGCGLKPSRDGWRIRYEGEKRSVIDGPFTETKELVAGYTLLQVHSREEAQEWALLYARAAACVASTRRKT
jgi:hypothetical protein